MAPFPTLSTGSIPVSLSIIRSLVQQQVPTMTLFRRSSCRSAARTLSVAGSWQNGKKVAMTVSRCEYKCSVDQLCIELNSAFYVLRERWNFSEARLLEIESSILNETYRFSYPSLSTLSETRSAKHEPRVLWLGKSADVPYFSRSSSEDSLVSIALARVISKRLQSCLYYSESSFGGRG